MFLMSEFNLRPTDSTGTDPDTVLITAVLGGSFQLHVQSTRVLVVLRTILIVSQQISLIGLFWCDTFKHCLVTTLGSDSMTHTCSAPTVFDSPVSLPGDSSTSRLLSS